MNAVVDAHTQSLRPMHEGDVRLVAEIERRSYEYPWPAALLRRALRSGWSCWVLEQNGAICGYGVLRVGGNWAHVMNLTVAAEFQRRGFGRRILTHLVALAQSATAELLWLEVRPGNAAAIRLYTSLGFRQRGVRRSYYPTRAGRQDALVMVLARDLDEQELRNRDTTWLRSEW